MGFLSPFKALRNKFKGPETVKIEGLEPKNFHPNKIELSEAGTEDGLLKISLDAYEARLRDAVDMAKQKLETAHAEEKAELVQKIVVFICKETFLLHTLCPLC